MSNSSKRVKRSPRNSSPNDPTLRSRNRVHNKSTKLRWKIKKVKGLWMKPHLKAITSLREVRLYS